MERGRSEMAARSVWFKNLEIGAVFAVWSAIDDPRPMREGGGTCATKSGAREFTDAEGKIFRLRSVKTLCITWD
jgi:hypothetical protein